MGHARAIVALAERSRSAPHRARRLSRGLSVRETEAIVKKAAAPGTPTSRAVRPATKDVHTRAAEEQLRLALGTAVEIKRRGKGGTVEIAFANEDELQRIYEYLTDSTTLMHGRRQSHHRGYRSSHVDCSTTRSG